MLDFTHTEAMSHLPGMLDHRLTNYPTYLPALSVDQWQLADRNNCTTMPLDHNYQPRTTHFMDNPRLIMQERHLEAVSRVTVTGLTGHHDLN